LRRQRDRCEYVLQRFRRTLVDRHPALARKTPNTSFGQAEISTSEKATAKILADNEMNRAHLKGLESSEEVRSAFAANMIEPDEVAVKWHAEFFNPHKRDNPGPGPIEQMLLAGMADDEDEAFLRSSTGALRYLQRIRAKRRCLGACHSSKQGRVFTTEVSPEDRLMPGDVMAFLALEITPRPTDRRRINLEGAFPSGEHANHNPGGERVITSAPVPAGRARIRGRLVHGATGRALEVAEIQALADESTPMKLTVVAGAERGSAPARRVVEFAEDGSYLLDVAPGEATVSFTPNRPWVLVDDPAGLKKTLSLAEGQDIRMDFWIVVKREGQNQ
jgi:hypothetical protein